MDGLEGLRLFRLAAAIALNGSVLLALAWFLPILFRQGQDDILQTLAGRLPVEALRKRWDRNT
jgi:hypothetical protein